MKIPKHHYLLSCLLTLQFLRADNPPQLQPDGVVIVTLGERRAVNEMAVYPQRGIAGRPLLVMAHSSGGSGPKEMGSWLDLAKQHNFTIVCPTFLSAVHSMHLPEDLPYFKDCLHWVEDNLQYDKKNVYMSGVSGGGFAVWYLGTTRPDFFRGLFLQSANFSGPYYGLDLSGWSHKPIKLIWGSKDLPDIPGQNAQALASLEVAHCMNYSSQIIQGGHHEEHRDLLITWMEHQVASQSSN